MPIESKTLIFTSLYHPDAVAAPFTYSFSDYSEVIRSYVNKLNRKRKGFYTDKVDLY